MSVGILDIRCGKFNKVATCNYSRQCSKVLIGKTITNSSPGLFFRSSPNRSYAASPLLSLSLSVGLL